MGEDRLVEHVVVRAGGYRCALRMSDVIEVHPYVAATPLPNAPAVVEGLVDVHGMVVAMIDLHLRFIESPRRPGMDDMLVIVATDDRQLALHVEHDVELVSLHPDQLRDTALLYAPYAQGVAVLSDELVVIYDIDAFLSSDELVALDAALRDSDSQAHVGPS